MLIIMIMKRLPSYYIIWYNFFNNNEIYTNSDDKNRSFFSLRIHGTTILFISKYFWLIAVYLIYLHFDYLKHS